MTDFETTSLYRINQLPLDADAEIFRQYPAFKLGVTASVRHYARLLLPLVKRLIAKNSERTNWILTGPAIATQTLAGANLLSRELLDLHRQDEDALTTKALALIEIEYNNEKTASIDYAKLDFADRVTERERLNSRLVSNSNFRGRPILFVNDICVTGAQQRAMQQYFEREGAAHVTWLYVVVVDPELGRTNPKIEWEINFCPFEDLLRLVSREQIQFTGKCVLRLMHLSIPELEMVLRALNKERRSRLLELAVLNGFQNLDGFQEQMELVRSYEARGIEESQDVNVIMNSPRITTA